MSTKLVFSSEEKTTFPGKGRGLRRKKESEWATGGLL